MLDLYFAPTPNGWKATIMLEECGLPYNLIAVRLAEGDQFKPEFLKISPNNRMPALVDHDAAQGPISIFESGAILMYLAEKTKRFLPQETTEKYRVLQWLFWQMAGLGPMAGQLSHFINYAPGGPEEHPYSHNRYKCEYDRLFSVMERVLCKQEFLGTEYSIADMACFPWILPYKRFAQELDSYPGLRRWYDYLKERPAVQKGIETGQELRNDPAKMTAEQWQMMFGQKGASVAVIAKKKADKDA